MIELPTRENGHLDGHFQAANLAETSFPIDYFLPSSIV